MSDDTNTATLAPEDQSTGATDPAPAKASRAPRTDLEADIKSVCDDYVRGTFAPPKTLTPHVIAAEIMRRRSDGTTVSGGAVAACLARWVNVGYIVAHDKPLAFADYTDAGRTIGLGELKRQHSARLASARAAEREAAKAGAPAVTPVAENAPF